MHGYFPLPSVPVYKFDWRQPKQLVKTTFFFRCATVRRFHNRAWLCAEEPNVVFKLFMLFSKTYPCEAREGGRFGQRERCPPEISPTTAYPLCVPFAEYPRLEICFPCASASLRFNQTERRERRIHVSAKCPKVGRKHPHVCLKSLEKSGSSKKTVEMFVIFNLHYSAIGNSDFLLAHGFVRR